MLRKHSSFTPEARPYFFVRGSHSDWLQAGSRSEQKPDLKIGQSAKLYFRHQRGDVDRHIQAFVGIENIEGPYRQGAEE